MSSKGGQTQGYRYYMALFSGLCRGPFNALVEIAVGDRTAWTGEADPGSNNYIDAPNLFGGDDKEGGIQGPFDVFGGAEDQVFPEEYKSTIGGLVSDMRGVATLWFDGLVAAMNPYLKPWKFRVQRSTAGWYNGVVWHPELCYINMGNGFGGDGSFPVTTNRPSAVTITREGDSKVVTFSRNPVENDTLTINGREIRFVADQKDKDLEYNEVDPDKNIGRTMQKLAGKINASASTFKVTAQYTNNSVTLSFINGGAGGTIHGMNPAHIIYQCYTDPLWGRGYPLDEIDETSFVSAAQTFYDENFGLALGWYRKENIDQFIQKIVNLAGVVTYTDRESGKLGIKAIRDDYEVESIPYFTPSTGLLSILDDDSASADNGFNEIIGTSTDPITNLTFQVRAQNPAALQSQGAASSKDQDYKGIPTRDLLARVVLRDLRSMAIGLKKYTVTLDRRAWRLIPGDVIRISDPRRGIEDLVLRLGEIDDGDMLKGQIKVKAVIDVFGLPSTSFVTPVQSDWSGPAVVAAPPVEQDTAEASYRDLYLARGADFVNGLSPDATYIGTLATAPNTTSLQYDLLTRAEGEADYREVGRADFTGAATLVEDVGYDETDWRVSRFSQFTGENVGQVLRVGGELVQLIALDSAAGTAEVKRGVGDTVPMPHESGEVLWTIDDDLKIDDRAYVAGETIEALALTLTSQQRLDPALATVMERTLTGRHHRPYPPADVRVDGVPFYEAATVSSDFEISWSTRNRLTQADVLVGYFENSVAPEAGQTTSVRISDAAGTVLNTYTGLEGTSWTYTPEMRAADGAAGRVNVEVFSERNGFTSRASTTFGVSLQTGWGYAWGFGWGDKAETWGRRWGLSWGG